MKTIPFLLVAASLVLALPAHASKGNAEAGKAKSTACAACHGEDGVSKIPSFPKLAGQHRDYLYHALKDYQSGKRTKAPKMGRAAKKLSAAQVADVAAYFATLK